MPIFDRTSRNEGADLTAPFLLDNNLGVGLKVISPNPVFLFGGDG